MERFKKSSGKRTRNRILDNFLRKIYNLLLEVSFITIKMSRNEENCSICLGKVENGVNLCSEKSHENFCYLCISSYIESTISSCVYGACPSITCPSLVHLKRKETKSLSGELWKEMISVGTLEKYNALANSLLMFRCGSCHSTKSLDVQYSKDSRMPLHGIIVSNSNDPTSQDAWHSFQVDAKLYSGGDIDADGFYTCIISKYLPKLKTCPDEKAWEMFIHVLKRVKDTAQRINLHLRYLRDRPKMKTLCCNSPHCFKCITYGHHDGKSCMENQTNSNNVIVRCPACNISLVKGDGCDSVMCVCGHCFCWSTEQSSRAYADMFLEQYPVDTHKHCANVLCSDNNTATTERQTAEAWRSINSIAVNMEMSLWFKLKYSQCVAQVCMLIRFSHITVPACVNQAAGLCNADNTPEFQKCREESKIARMSLFTTMYPREEDRIYIAQLASQSAPFYMSTNTEMSESIRLWSQFASVTPTSMRSSSVELIYAKQFIYLYGTRSIQNTLVEIVSCTQQNQRRKIFGSYLSEMNKISARLSELFSLFDGSGYSELRCDANIWVTMNNNDAELAAERYHSMEDAIWYVMNINYANTVQDITTQTSYDLTTLNALTWNDLIAVLSWCRENEGDVGQEEYFGSLFS